MVDLLCLYEHRRLAVASVVLELCYEMCKQVGVAKCENGAEVLFFEKAIAHSKIGI